MSDFGLQGATVTFWIITIKFGVISHFEILYSTVNFSFFTKGLGDVKPKFEN